MTVYRVGPFSLNAERLSLHAGDKPVPLGPRAVATLLALVERAGEAVGKRVLLDCVWPEGFVEESNLAQNIYVLRKLFREHGAPAAIETVPQLGYRLTTPVEHVVQPPAANGRFRNLSVSLAAVTACGLMLGLLLLSQGLTGVSHHSGSTLSPDARRLYVIGRYYWNLRTADGVRKSFAYFARVIDANPENPLGYAAMADANVTMGDYCFGAHRPAIYFARARSYAEKALALDPNSAQAHAALGFAELHGSKTELGLSELRHAMALDPAYAAAHEWYGIWLLRQGDPYRATSELRVAADLEPLSVSTTRWLGVAALRLKRPNEAALYAKEALEFAPAGRTVPPSGHPTWAELENASHASGQHG